MKILLKVVTIIAAAMPTVASALPYENGVVIVGDRQFMIGEVTRAFSDHWIKMPLGHSEILREFLAGEPLLSFWKAEFLETGIPARELVGDLSRHFSDTSKVQQQPQLQVEGHDVFSSGEVWLSIFPKTSELNYSARCSRGHQTDILNFCSVRVVYPYDTNVALTASAFSPGTLPDVSQDFEAIAQRMIEIATCLDVTEEMGASLSEGIAAVLTANPTLSGCTIDVTS